MRKDFHQKLNERKVKSDIFILWRLMGKHLRTIMNKTERKINEFLNAFCAFSFTLKLIATMFNEMFRVFKVMDEVKVEFVLEGL